jgi:hypothetical protein
VAGIRVCPGPAEGRGPSRGRSGSAGGYDGYKPLVIEICKFFKTGKPPVSMEETLEIYTFMEAADESKRRGGAPVTIAEVMAKAGAVGDAKR